MDGSSLLGGDAEPVETTASPMARPELGSGLSEVLVDVGQSGEEEDPEDWVIKRPDGTRWSTEPTNTWSLYKLFITIICFLSVFEGLGSLGCLWVFSDIGAWWSFAVTLTFLLISSCLTAIGGTVLNEPNVQQQCQCAPFLLSFCKMGAFRIAWRTVWFPDLRAAPQEDDLSEHLLPLSIFFMLVCIIESTPLLVIKTYVFGLLLGESPAAVGDMEADTVQSAWLISLSVMVSVAFQALIPLLYDKVGTDFRMVYVRAGRTTPFHQQLFRLQHCATLFLLRFFEGMTWLTTLAAVAMSAGGWFFLVFFLDFAMCTVFACAFADPGEEDWELAATFRVLFSLFYTNPLHDGDAIMVFRARAPSIMSLDPTLFPSVLHYGWRTAMQFGIVTFVYFWRDDPESVPYQDDTVLVSICGAIIFGTGATIGTLFMAVRMMPQQEEVAESLLQRRRPDGIMDALYEAVVEGDVDLYSALAGEESLEVRAWVFREHWYRNRPKGSGRLEMTVNRDDFVNSVLDGVSNASPQKLQRGSRVVFEDGEKGIDAGGLTREMYAQFAIQTLEMPTEKRVFRETAMKHLVPEPLAPEVYGAECERLYRGYGRICGMALAMGELANFTFAPFFLRQVLLPDLNPSVEELLADLKEEDPMLVKNMESVLATAKAEQEAKESGGSDADDDLEGTVEDLCLSFERRMSTSMEVLGVERSISLLPDGGDGSGVDVTGENARDFVEAYMRHKMHYSIMEQTQAFRAGMLDVLQEAGLLALFTAEELVELLGGTAGIDDAAVLRWRTATQLSGAQPDDETVLAFWAAIGQLTEEERGMVR